MIAVKITTIKNYPNKFKTQVHFRILITLTKIIFGNNVQTYNIGNFINLYKNGN